MVEVSVSTKAQMRRDVAKAKNRLVKKALRTGLYENFGDKEYRKLDEKYSDYRYTPEFRDIITGFWRWSGEFDQRDLRRERERLERLR